MGSNIDTPHVDVEHVPNRARKIPHKIFVLRPQSSEPYHPEQGPWWLFRDLMCPQNPIFGTHKEACAKKWVLRAQQLPLHAHRTLTTSFENRRPQTGNTQQFEFLASLTSA